MWKVFWISTGCRNQAACCLVACIIRTKALLSNLIILETLTINAGFWGLLLLLLFSLKFYHLLVQLLFWELQFSFKKRKVKSLETLASAWWFRKKKLHKGEPGCVANVPSHHTTFRHVIFWHYLLPRECDEGESWARFSHGIKAWLQKTQGFLRRKPWVLSRFEAKPLFAPPGFLLAFAHVFPPWAVSVFWSGDKQ